MISAKVFFMLWQRSLIALFSCILIYGGFRLTYSPNPVTSADIAISIAIRDEQLKLTEVRRIVGHMETTVRLTHTFYKEDNPSNFFTLEGGTIDVIKGEFVSVYSAYLPKWVQGKWCKRTKIIYLASWPRFEHTYSTADICFETSDHE